MEARVTAQSQSLQLIKRMEEAEIHHAQEIRADLPGLRVIAVAGEGEGQLRFCDLGPIQVRAILNSGNGRPLPTKVVLEGLTVPAPGTYDILNARLSSNGDIRLVVDDQTSVKAVPTPPRHSDEWDWHEFGCCGLSYPEIVL